MTFPIPAAALAQHSAILGKTGAGKTNTAKGIVEHLVSQGARVCVLDPIKSDWWGLTSSADGKRAGLPFHILGGPRGHVPLHPGSGKAIAEIVANGTLPLSIIDMADFPAGGLARFFIDFAPTLLRRMNGVVHLVMEEAHEFAPKERSGIGDENMQIHHAKRLATAGRSRGVRLIVVTQRTQALHNALLGSCETMIAHRLTAPADQKPVTDWLKANVEKGMAQEISGSLASLKTGTAWVCSGEAQFFKRVPFPRIRTYDNSATPEAGALSRDEVRTAPVDVERLRAIVGDAAKDAEANDPKLLKAEVARVTGLLAKAMQQASKPVEKINMVDQAAHDAEVNGAYKTGWDTGWDAGCQQGFLDGVARSPQLFSAFLETAKGKQNAADFYEPPRSQYAGELPMAPRAAPARRETQSTVFPKPAAQVNQTVKEGALEGPLQRIVDSIRWWNVLGHNLPTAAQVGFIAKYKPRGGSWDTYLSRLRSRGLILPRGGFVLTEAGLALANEPAEIPSGETLRANVMALIAAPLQKILGPILEAYPDGLIVEDAGAASGYVPKGGSWDTYVSRLRSLELIERRTPLKAQSWLFP